MTNKEYIEKNNISFAEAMKMWDEKNYPCINDWLKANRIECPFKVGDFLRHMYYDDVICVVIDIQDYVYYKMIKRDGTFVKWVFGNQRNASTMRKTILYMHIQLIGVQMHLRKSIEKIGIVK